MTKHRGFKITTRNTIANGGVKCLAVMVDGHVLCVNTGRDREAALTSAALYVDDSIARPDAYTWTRDLTPAQLERKLAVK